MKNIDTVEVLKELISIPSWVDNKTNEILIGNWIMDFLSKNSSLTITKQNMGNERFNIFAANSKNINTLVTGHMDTVQPNTGWTKNPIKPGVKSGKIYGLGTTDMKSGVAIMLYLATLPDLKPNTGLLFYCDEEFDFLGMKRFISEYKNKIKPRVVISLDGEGLQINNSCRGLIEVKIKVQGKAGHAADPKSGINAITESFKVIIKLKEWLKSFKSSELGISTLNIASVNGGGTEGNVIAENCEYIAEVRVANTNLTADKVCKYIKLESEKLGLIVTATRIRHDLRSWITNKNELSEYTTFAPKKGIKSAKKSGYIDIQMLWENFDNVPTFSLGIGEIGMSHKADEYISISNIMKATEFFKKLLTK